MPPNCEARATAHGSTTSVLASADATPCGPSDTESNFDPQIYRQMNLISRLSTAFRAHLQKPGRSFDGDRVVRLLNHVLTPSHREWGIDRS